MTSPAHRAHLAARAKLNPLTAYITLDGIDLTVEYQLDGRYLPADDVNDACRPAVLPEHVFHRGEEITKLLSEERLVTVAEMIEGGL